MRGLAPQWPPAHTYTLGQGRGNVANDRVLVWGELTTSAGLSGPLLTDHTGKCLPRAHDFQFFHWKRLLGKGGQEARDDHLCFSQRHSVRPPDMYQLSLLPVLSPGCSLTTSQTYLPPIHIAILPPNHLPSYCPTGQ